MKPLRFRIQSLLVILAAVPAPAVTDTWDGGGANSNLSTNANWVDNTAPVSSLANTDLIFGTVPEDSAAVNFSAAFSAHSLTIEDADGFLVFYTFSGQTLSVGTGGIAHDGGMSATFTNPVSFSGVANSTINEGFVVTFANTVTLPTNTLTVNVNGDGETFFDNFSGSGALTKSGAGIMNWTPTATANVEINVSAGTLRMRADDVTDVLGSGGSIAVNGSSDFEMRDNFTLDGGNLTRGSGASVLLAAGKTLRVQDGGDVTMTGPYANMTDSTITVTGAGSTFTGTSSLSFNGASALNVTAGGDVDAATAVNVGTAGNGTAFVSGSGSSLSGANFNVASAGDTGSAVFSSSSTGSFATINVATSSEAGTSGTLTIQSGASVTATALVIANVAGGADGAVTITGAGSALTVTGTGITAIGAGVQNTGALNLSNSGTFNSGTGSATVRPTGSIVINGGTYNSNGDLTLTGGKLERLSGEMNLAAGTTFTIQSGGDAEFTGAFSNDTASSILVTGAGSTLSTAAAALSINGGSTLSALLGADVSTSGGAFGVGTGAGASGNGTVSITDAGSSLGAGALNVGQNGNTASLTFSGASTGTFTSIGVDNSGVAGTSGLLEIQSGAVVTGTSLALASTSAANTGTVTITGMSSALTLSGAATATIGASANSSGTLNVGTRAAFNSGTGLTTVNATGTIAIIDSGTFNANGNVTLNGGQLTRDAQADFLLDAGRTFTVQNGGDATFTGPYTNATASSIVVTGAGSTLSTTGNLTISGGSTLSVAAGGNVSCAAAMSIGTSNSGTVTVGNGGTFTTGTGLTTVSATGDLNINAGGTLTGASDFAGPGPVNIAGAYRPGAASGVDQTTSVSFAQAMTFQPTTGITMEVGGIAPGTQHDQLVFNGPGATHVTWNGTLNLVLINGFAPQAGQTFDLFDFDAARDAGSFTTINLPALPAGVTFNFDDLYTTGIISVVPTTGTTFAQWAAAVLGDPGALPQGDHNSNGYDNLTEYALAFLPVFPGASEPGGSLHVYPDGERMRVLFWRHIDRTDITIRVQVSTNLVSWSDLAVSVNSAPFTGAGFVSENRTHPLSEPGLVEVRDILNASDEARRHLRIIVTLSP